MFLLRLAKDLGQSLESIMELSTAELEIWSAYYQLEADQMRQAQQRARAKRK